MTSWAGSRLDAGVAKGRRSNRSHLADVRRTSPPGAVSTSMTTGRVPASASSRATVKSLAVDTDVACTP